MKDIWHSIKFIHFWIAFKLTANLSSNCGPELFFQKVSDRVSGMLKSEFSANTCYDETAILRLILELCCLKPNFIFKLKGIVVVKLHYLLAYIAKYFNGIKICVIKIIINI